MGWPAHLPLVGGGGVSEPPPNPSPVEEPKNSLAPYCTSLRHPTLNGTDGLAGVVEQHNTSPYKRQKCSSATIVVLRTENRNGQQR